MKEASPCLVRQRPRPAPWIIAFRSPLSFALCASAFILVIFNLRYWNDAAKSFWTGDVESTLFLASLFICLLFLHALAVLTIPGARVRIVVLGLLCPVAAMAAYCADSFGLPVDREMIRNIGRTDYREVQGLFSYRLVLYVLLLGMLPVLLLARSKIAPVSMKRHMQDYAIVAGASAAALAMLFLAFPNQAASLATGKLRLHYLLVPGAALSASLQHAHDVLSSPPTASDAAPAPTVLLQRAPGARPLLLFLVIGETARHKNFQLGGYERPTNPQLSGVDNLIYFPHVESCATTTALSVPCMLSPLGRAQFDLPAMRAGDLALHALQRAGVHVQWRTNNSGSQDVHQGLATLNAASPGAFPDCSPWSCLDEVLLSGLEESIRQHGGDQIIVFHQMGSHGPDYFRRYPPSFETFKPACRSNVLQECSNEEIRNAYDNTIVYTDHLLKQKIDILKQVSKEFDALLMYVSDHGESLGENGIHLHGIPYEWAPPEQTRVPLIIWTSQGYADRFKLAGHCLRQQALGQYSHSNLYHTLIGAMQANNPLYRKKLDILAACRN